MKLTKVCNVFIIKEIHFRLPGKGKGTNPCAANRGEIGLFKLYLAERL